MTQGRTSRRVSRKEGSATKRQAGRFGTVTVSGKKISHVYPFQKSPRCSATSKRTRRPCMAPAVTGWTVCRFHGARGGGTKCAAAREGRSRNQQNHQRLLNAASALFARAAKLAWFCSAPVAQRIVLVRFKRALPPSTYAVSGIWSRSMGLRAGAHSTSQFLEQAKRCP
jgi:hypothetical protein